MRNLTFAIFLCYLAAVTVAISAPVRTDKITTPVPILSSMAWLADPDSKYTMSNIDSQGVQAKFRHLQGGFPVASTGAGWLRLELEKTPPSVGTLPRSSTNQLTLHINTLPAGSTTIFYQNNNAPVTTPGYWYSTKLRDYETFVLPEPPLNGTIIYLHLEETPDLWFNPSLSRGFDNGNYLFPPTLLLPGLFLVLASVCLLRSLRDRVLWPFWAALIFAATFVQLALPLPVSQQQLDFSALPALLAPGLCLLVFPHLGRLMLQPRAYSKLQDTLLKTTSILGVIVSIIPLIPGYMWLTRLYLLWPLLLVVLLPFCFSALNHKRPGALPFTGVCLMGFAGALLALCSISYPALHYMAAYGSMWGLVVGGAGLVFARVPREERQATPVANNMALLGQPPHFDELEADTSPSPQLSSEEKSKEEDELASNLLVSHALAMDNPESDPLVASSHPPLHEGQAEEPLSPKASGTEKAYSHVAQDSVANSHEEPSFTGTIPLPKSTEAQSAPNLTEQVKVEAVHHERVQTSAKPAMKAPESAVSPPAPPYPPITNTRPPESTSPKNTLAPVAKGASSLVSKGTTASALPDKKETPSTNLVQPDTPLHQNAMPHTTPTQSTNFSEPMPQAKPNLPTLHDLPAILQTTMIQGGVNPATIQGHSSASKPTGLVNDFAVPQANVMPSSVSDQPQPPSGNAEKKIRIISLADDNFMDFSDMQRGYGSKSLGAPGKAQIFSLHRLLKEVSTSIESVAQNKGILFSWFIAPSLPATLEGDATNLRHVLSLLLQNALQATQKGTVQLFVRPTSGGGPSDMGNLQFSISDTGTAQRSDLGFSHAWEFAERTGGNFSIEYSVTGGTLVMFSSCFMVPSEEIARLSLNSPPAQPAKSNNTQDALKAAPTQAPTQAPEAIVPKNAMPLAPAPSQSPPALDPNLIGKQPAPATASPPATGTPSTPLSQADIKKGEENPTAALATEEAKPLWNDGIDPAIPRIAIVGMTTSNKRLLSHYMGGILHLFVEVQDIAKALEICRQIQPVLVMYDADSPEDSIFSSLNAINAEQKEQGVNPLAQLVFVGHEAQGKRMLDHGATHVIVKPFSPEDLTSLLKAAVPQFRSKQEEGSTKPFAASVRHEVPDPAIFPAPGTSTESSTASQAQASPESKVPKSNTPVVKVPHLDIPAPAPNTQAISSSTAFSPVPSVSAVFQKPQPLTISNSIPTTQATAVTQATVPLNNTVVPQATPNTAAPQKPATPANPAPVPIQQKSSPQGVQHPAAAKNEPFEATKKQVPVPASTGTPPHTGQTAAKPIPKILLQPILKFPARVPEVVPPAPKPSLPATPVAVTPASPSSATVVHEKSKQNSAPNRLAVPSTPVIPSAPKNPNTLNVSKTSSVPSVPKSPPVTFQQTQSITAKKTSASAMPEFIPEQSRPATGPTLSMGDGPPQVSPGTFYPLPGFPDESIDAIMLPLIPGFLHTLDGSLAAAVKGRDEHQTLFVQDAVALLATKAEVFNLEKLSKIARCVERAAAADDFEAVDVLLDDLITVAKRYGNSMKIFYNNYLNQHR